MTIFYRIFRLIWGKKIITQKKEGLVLHQPNKKYYLKICQGKSLAPKLNKVIKHILGGFA